MLLKWWLHFTRDWNKAKQTGLWCTCTRSIWGRIRVPWGPVSLKLSYICTTWLHPGAEGLLVETCRANTVYIPLTEGLIQRNSLVPRPNPAHMTPDPFLVRGLGLGTRLQGRGRNTGPPWHKNPWKPPPSMTPCFTVGLHTTDMCTFFKRSISSSAVSV